MQVHALQFVPLENVVHFHQQNQHYFNLLNAKLNPICKSQFAEFFCGVFKFCAWYLKNLNISRTKRDKFVKQKAFCGEGKKHCLECLKML